jgi:hypothetical protein
MGTVSITHRIDLGAIHAVLTSPGRGVAQDMFRRGHNVAARAKKNLASSPKRIDTGLLRSSIQVRMLLMNGSIAVDISTNVFYARFVHDGTGLYGPRHRMIVPINAKVLRWTNGRKTVFSMKSRGMRPNPFLKNALRAARD